MDPPATIVNRGVMIDESSPQDEHAIESRVRHVRRRGLAAPAPANERAHWCPDSEVRRHLRGTLMRASEPKRRQKGQ